MQPQWRCSGKRKEGSKQNETQFTKIKWCISEFHSSWKANVLFPRFLFNLTGFGLMENSITLLNATDKIFAKAL